MKLFLSILFASGLISYLIVEDTPLPIGKGKMPTLALDKKGNIHLIYGRGDSLLYSTSTDHGKSFSKPELIKLIEGLAASATRGPQIAVTRNGVSVIASTNAGNIW